MPFPCKSRQTAVLQFQNSLALPHVSSGASSKFMTHPVACEMKDDYRLTETDYRTTIIAFIFTRHQQPAASIRRPTLVVIKRVQMHCSPSYNPKTPQCGFRPFYRTNTKEGTMHPNS